MQIFDLSRIRQGINEVVMRGGRPRKLKLSPQDFEAFKSWAKAQITYPAKTSETRLLGLRVVEEPHLPPDTIVIL